MNVLCRALPPENSDACFLIFDWSPEFVALLKQYRQLIRNTELVLSSEFLHITLSVWSCAVIESIDEGAACDGLLQAKEKVENDELEFVFLDDSVDIETGVETMRVSFSTVNIDAKRFHWEIGTKYEDGAIESPQMDIPDVEVEAQT